MKYKDLSFYCIVFLISASIITLQIFQSRIFSVTTWYHLSFLAVSFAMFGMTLGALKVYAGNESQQRLDYGVLIQKHTFSFALAVFSSLLAQLFVPIISTDVLGTLITLPIVAAVTCWAYYHGGVVITICLTRTPYPLAKTYGIDLLGAGFGCIMALLVMETIDTPSGVILLVAAVLFSALLFKEEFSPNSYSVNKPVPKKIISFFLIFVLVLGAGNAFLKEKILFPYWVKDSAWNHHIIEYEKWNSISRVTVHEVAESKPYLWGPSPVMPQNFEVPYKFLLIDGSAGTPITGFDGDFSKHQYLEYDVTNLAYNLPNISKAAIIGVGGGRDLLSAKYFGVQDVWALDVNPVQVDLLNNIEKYKNYTNLSTQPGVHIINSEARSWFRNNNIKMDLVQMSLIDTWASTGAGAFALSENGIYTVEAWNIFIDDLSPNGVFTVSRWSSDSLDDSGRMVSVAVAALLSMGVDDVQNHIAVVKSHNIATLVVSKSSMTVEQISAIKNVSKDKEYQIILLPGQVPHTVLLKSIIEAKSVEDIEKISAKHRFDVTPSTDMRPFFFNQAKFSNPLDIVEMALSKDGVNDGVSYGQAKATFNLFIIIILSLVMVTVTIIYPMLKKSGDMWSYPAIRAGTLYFVLIGLGFMLVEISLLNALGVYLGHPIYGLGVVLFSLIVFAGIGSLISGKIPLDTLSSQFIWSLGIFSYCVGLSLSLNNIFVTYAETDMISRALISVAIVAPAGILMGFGFPTGLKIMQAYDSRATAWFWGINGATGVLGSCIALAFNICFGVDKTLMLGGFCYLLLCLVFYRVHTLQKAA